LHKILQIGKTTFSKCSRKENALSRWL